MVLLVSSTTKDNFCALLFLHACKEQMLFLSPFAINRAFYNYFLSDMAFEWQQGWR